MIPKPMLAHVYEPSKNPAFPCYVQPKLDGVRCLTYVEGNALVCMSRNGKELHIPPAIHALPELVLDLMVKGLVLDGELYIHGQGFQTVVSVVKRRDHPDAPRLEYHVYDCFHHAMDTYGGDSYEARLRLLNKIWNECGPTMPEGVRLVSTSRASDRAALDSAHASYVKAGYEGSIIRNPTFPYKGSRSFGLLKRKDFLDDEFVVTAVEEGVGKNAGTAILVCRSVNGRQFTATAPGTYAEKARIWHAPTLFVGKKVTIRYQELSDDGIPRFPIATGFPEDR